MSINSSNSALFQIQFERKQIEQQSQNLLASGRTELLGNLKMRDDALGRQEDMIKYTSIFGGNAAAATRVADVDQYISDLEFGGVMLALKKQNGLAALQANPNRAAEILPIIALVDNEISNILNEHQRAHQDKSILIAQNAKPQAQAQPNIIESLKALLGISKPEAKADTPEQAALLHAKNREQQQQSDIIEYTKQFKGNTAGADTVATINRHISDLKFALQMIDMKKAEYQDQANANPALAGKYQEEISKLDEEVKQLNLGMSDAQQDKANMVNYFTKNAGKAVDPSIAQLGKQKIMLIYEGQDPAKFSIADAQVKQIESQLAQKMSDKKEATPSTDKNSGIEAMINSAKPAWTAYDTNTDGTYSADEANKAMQNSVNSAIAANNANAIQEMLNSTKK